MMTSIWGPPMWHILHTLSFNYPINPSEEQKRNYYNFYSNLQNILPCKYCRDNLTNNFSKLPLSMDIFKNRDVLSRYIYNLHELVNTMLGKTSGLCYEDVRDRYEHFRSRCLENPKKIKENNYKKNIEKGCTEPLYGVKSKCVLNIVPKDNRLSSFKMDPKCVLTKGSKQSKQSKQSNQSTQSNQSNQSNQSIEQLKKGSKKGSKKLIKKKSKKQSKKQSKNN